MQKKIVLALLFAAFVAGGAFAQISLSAGGGALFDLSGNNDTKFTGTYPAGVPNEYKIQYSGTRNTSFGAFGFFDVTYAELDVYFAFGSLKSAVKPVPKNYEADKSSTMQLGFSLLGKYPIDMGNFTIFPLVGIDYNRVLSLSSDGVKVTEGVGDLSQFGFLGGIGGDIKFNNSPLFVRVEGLLHIRLPSKVTKEFVDDKKKLDKDSDLKTTWGIGPQIKVALGYRF
jgi:hypothetical protein